MQPLLDNDLYLIQYDAARQLIIMRRSSIGLTATNGPKILPGILATLRPLRGQRLLIDVRQAPGNNDASIEQLVQELRRHLSELFPSSATLAATAVGRLQITRLSRERKDPGTQVFLSESEAIQYLMAQAVPAPTRRPGGS